MKTRLFSAISHSDDPDIEDLARDLITDCEQQLNGRIPQAGILLAGIHLNHQDLLKSLMHVWPDLHLIGCTTDGETSSVKGTMLESASLMLFYSETLEFSSGTLEQQIDALEKNGVTTLLEAANQASQPPTLGLLLADGLLFNSSILLEIALQAFGEEFPWFGGMAADQWLFSGTLQFYRDRVVKESASFLLLHGELAHSSAISLDWEAVGEMGKVSRAERNVVYEIGQQPAVQFFHNLLGQEAIPSNDNPIAVYDAAGDFRFLRTCFETYDPDTGTMHFNADIPEGHHVRLTVARRDNLITGAAKAAQQALEDFSAGVPAAALCFTCSGRRALLGSRVGEEIVAVRQALGDKIPLVGFYSYGEIAPTTMDSSSCVHNQTFTIILLG